MVKEIPPKIGVIEIDNLNNFSIQPLKLMNSKSILPFSGQQELGGAGRRKPALWQFCTMLITIFKIIQKFNFEIYMMSVNILLSKQDTHIVSYRD